MANLSSRGLGCFGISVYVRQFHLSSNDLQNRNTLHNLRKHTGPHCDCYLRNDRERVTIGDMGIASINPSTGKTLKTFEALTSTEIEDKLQLAIDTFNVYRHTTFSNRSEMMTR